MYNFKEEALARDNEGRERCAVLPSWLLVLLLRGGLNVAIGPPVGWGGGGDSGGGGGCNGVVNTPSLPQIS